MMSKKPDYDVFVCYNNDDQLSVINVADQLKSKGLRVWLDKWELRPGIPWQRELEKQISTIGSVAVFVANSGLGPWQRHEIDAFLREFVRRKVPVIPVILPGVTKQPKLPVFLNAMDWVDFRNPNPDPLDRLIYGISGTKPGTAGHVPSHAELYGILQGCWKYSGTVEEGVQGWVTRTEGICLISRQDDRVTIRGVRKKGFSPDGAEDSTRLHWSSAWSEVFPKERRLRFEYSLYADRKDLWGYCAVDIGDEILLGKFFTTYPNAARGRIEFGKLPQSNTKKCIAEIYGEE